MPNMLVRPCLSFLFLAALSAPLRSQCELQKVRQHAGAFGNFGNAVAVSSDLLLVGAPGEFGVFSTGAGYVFERQGSEWVETQLVHPDDLLPGAQFGTSVALDGVTAAFGAPFQGRGAVYIYERDGSTLAFRAKIIPQAPLDTGFGVAVDIDGERLIVGSRFEDPGGVVYVFERSGDQWLETARVESTDPEVGALGTSLDLEGDRFVAGAPFTAFHAGAAYVYELGAQGWESTAKLVTDDPQFAPEDHLGISVALHGDVVVAGTEGYDLPDFDVGAAFVFELDGSEWVERAKLSPSDGALGDTFGHSVALADGVAWIGSPAHTEGVDTGAVYVFTRDGDRWSERRKATGNAGIADEKFGSSLALADEIVAIGAPRLGLGSVYLLGTSDGSATYYCSAAPNSAGVGAFISYQGSASVQADDSALYLAGGVHDNFAVLCYGPEQAAEPFGDGISCVGPGSVGVFRIWPPVQTDGQGEVGQSLDFDRQPVGSGPGAIFPGTTWSFQFWYRDPQGPGGSGFNLSDAVSVSFCP